VYRAMPKSHWAMLRVGGANSAMGYPDNTISIKSGEGALFFCAFEGGRIRRLGKLHVEERLRMHMRKQYKIRFRGGRYERFSTRVSYERHGLFKAPTSASWKNVHTLV